MKNCKKCSNLFKAYNKNADKVVFNFCTVDPEEGVFGEKSYVEVTNFDDSDCLAFSEKK